MRVTVLGVWILALGSYGVFFYGTVYGDDGVLDHGNPMLFRDESGRVGPVRTKDEWAVRRRQIMAGMQEVMGPLPGEERRIPLVWRVTETVELDGFTRKRIEIDVEKGDSVPAYLLIPAAAGLKGRAPAVLCLHQTTKIGKGSPAGLGDRPALFQAVELARRGT